MTEIRIIVRCKENPDHAKILRMNAECPRYYADDLARLLDGTSHFFIHKPGKMSPVSWCGICHGQLTATVEEVETRDAKPKRKPSAD